MESWRAPLASIAGIPPRRFLRRRKSKGKRLKLQLASKRDIMLAPCTDSALSVPKNNLLRKKYEYTRGHARERRSFVVCVAEISVPVRRKRPQLETWRHEPLLLIPEDQDGLVMIGPLSLNHYGHVKGTL